MPVDTVIPGPKVTDTTKRKIPFRRATVERTTILNSLTPAMATTEVPQLNEVKGTGYIFGIWTDVNTVTASNTAAVAFAEDAPWNALSSVILSDVNGELVNLQGFDLYCVNLAMKLYAYRHSDLSLGNVLGLWQGLQTFTVTLTPAIVATITVAEQTFAAPLSAGDVVVSVSKPTTQAGLGIAGWRNAGAVASPLAIAYVNPTAAGITPTAGEVYTVTVIRNQAGLPTGAPTQGAGFFSLTPGSTATGGSFRFQVRLPVAINRRDLIGLIGNQDRAQKYELRQNLNSSGNIYGTSPTTLPSPTITNIYENYTVPLGTSPSGAPQEQFPPTFGTLHFVTAANLSEAPVPSSTVTHYLKRVGNTARYLILIFRAGTGTTPRNVADLNVPTRIVFKVGEDPIFSETWPYRREIMFERFGFDWPGGVLVYDAMHDFQAGAGNEVGDDYLHTQALVNAQFEITYPSGFTTGGSLRVITDDMLFVPPQAVVPS